VVARDRSPLNLETVLLTTQKIYYPKMMDVNEEKNQQIMDICPINPYQNSLAKSFFSRPYLVMRESCGWLISEAKRLGKQNSISCQEFLFLHLRETAFKSFSRRCTLSL
jgi:hypothetical protein